MILLLFIRTKYNYQSLSGFQSLTRTTEQVLQSCGAVSLKGFDQDLDEMR